MVDLSLTWRDHYLRGAFDSEKAGGTAITQAIYLGPNGVADVVVRALDHSGLASGWHTRLEHDDRHGRWMRTPVADAAAARAVSRASNGSYAIASDEAELRMFLAGSRSLSIDVDLAHGDRLGERVGEKLLAFETYVRTNAPAELVRSPVLAACAVPTPRLRPRRRYAYWPANAIVLVVDREQLMTCIAQKTPGGKTTEPSANRYTKGMLAELDVIAAAPLPSGATRTTHGPRLVLDFTATGRTLGDAAAVFERWLCELPLEKARHPDDSSLGDPAAFGAYQLGRAPEGSGLTLYNPYFHEAYSADVRVDDTIANPEKLARLAEAKARGALVTGQPVGKVGLIVPSREDAVALAHLVASGRVDCVAYLHEEVLRDPNILGASVWHPWPDEKTKRAAKKKPAAKKPAAKKTAVKKTAAKKKR